MRSVSTIKPLLTMITALAVISPHTGVKAEVSGTRRALIFAPANYTSLPDSTLHSQGARELRRQLLRSGFTADHVQVLSGRGDTTAPRATAGNFLSRVREMANTVQAQDVMLVAVLSYGFHTGDTDLVAGEDSTEAEIRTLNQAGANRLAGTLISIQDVAAAMKNAATSRQLLVVDGAVESTLASRLPDNTAFGNGELRLKTGQYVVMNRRAAVRRGITQFNASVCDAFSEFADADEDALISRDELVEHIQRYAETFGLTPLPTVRGNLVDDFELAEAGTMDGAGAFTPAIRDRMARTLVRSARQLLLIVQDPEAAQNVLKRAIAYRPSQEIKDEISSMLLTLLASRGDVDQAWAEAQTISQPLLVLSTGEFTIRAGKRTLATVEPGELVLLTRRQGDWLHPATRFEVRYDDGEVAFRELETPSGWADRNEIRVARNRDSSGEPSRSLIRILRRLNSQESRQDVAGLQSLN